MKKRFIYICLVFILTSSFSFQNNNIINAKSDFQIRIKRGEAILVKYAGKSRSVRIPSGIDSIGDSAFRNNKKVQKVIFSKSVKEIHANAFANCTNLKKIKFNINFKRIINQPFVNCKKIKSIHITKKVNYISEFGFVGLTGLEKVTVSKKNKHFKKHKGTLYTKKLKTLIVYPKNKKNISKYIIPKQTKTVNACAFSDNKYIKKIIIKGKINCGEDSFSNMKSLKTVQFKRAYKSPVPFYNCRKLKEVKLAEGTEQICEEQFYNCTSLVRINIPKSIKFIGKRAFRGCKNLQLPLLDKNVVLEHPIK